ncbi:type II toxin-antitoxin system ParD family antitoxin [Methylobacterium sp. ID0610]|uniref:type II toxin-antitoxin system ParD family antitoxin n=1 Tax=Methylobacterium carpenticola TaxID=3344827 RepID=UPI0036C632DE
MRQTIPTTASLGPELRPFVAERIASGRFGSAGEVVRASLRLLQEGSGRDMAGLHAHP